MTEFDVTITVPYFVSTKGRITWHPWADAPRGALIGWRGEFHHPSGPDDLFCYLMPVDALRPEVLVYVGPHGDPKLDKLQATVTMRVVKP